MPLLSTSFPPELRPSVDDIASLAGTRTVAADGTPSKLFDSTTEPTATQVGALIDQAMGPILSQLPAAFDTRFYDQAKHMIALYTAILIEGSYHRDKLNDNSAVSLWHQLLTDGMKVLREDTGTVDGAGPQFGSIRVVSVPSPACLPGVPDGFQPLRWPC